MTDEVILGVIGTAVSIAQMIPLFSKSTPKPGRIAAGLTIAIIVIGSGVWVRSQLDYKRSVERAKRDVLAAVALPKTFDQLLSELYYPDYYVLSDAVDEMVAEKKLEQRRISAVSRTGDTLELRVYAVPPSARQSGQSTR